MKRNFNIIKNLDVPESWIENAVNIPHTATKKHFKPYLIGTAASVVAVSTAVLFFNSKLSIQEFPMSPSASTLPQESYSQSELNRQQVENDSSDKLVEPTDNIVEGSPLSASEPKETVTEEVTAATSYPFVPPATGYISGQYADSPDNIFMGILVFKIDERFKDSNYLFCHITEHGKEFSFCEKYINRLYGEIELN